jgi:hypothetical protein
MMTIFLFKGYVKHRYEREIVALVASDEDHAKKRAREIIGDNCEEIELMDSCPISAYARFMEDVG